MEINPKKIFVGNLPFSATNGTLESLFRKYGQIDGVKIVRDRATDRPKVNIIFACLFQYRNLYSLTIFAVMIYAVVFLLPDHECQVFIMLFNMHPFFRVLDS